MMPIRHLLAVDAFTWPIHPQYRWVVCGPEAKLRLGAVVRTAERYFPLAKYPALFRLFASTSPDPDSILAFAARYGSLTAAVPEVQVQGPEADEPVVLTKDTPKLWRDEVVALRQAVALWDLCQAGDVAGLSRHIRWIDGPGGPTVAYHGGSEPDARVGSTVGTIASPEVRPGLLELFNPGDLLLPAQMRISQVINNRLKRRARPQLIWDAPSARMTVQLVPIDLLGAAWLQFGVAVANKTQFRACKVCREWFELTPETARKSRLFCSNACRSKAYRDRQEQARQLRSEGKSLKDIAAELDSDVGTVKKWVGQ